MEKATWTEVECPGCLRTVTFATTRPARVEWDQLEDGRRIGWVSCEVESDWPHFAVRLQEIGSPSSILLGDRRIFKVHECERGGGAGDRAALPSEPPLRASSIALDPDDIST